MMQVRQHVKTSVPRRMAEVMVKKSITFLKTVQEVRVDVKERDCVILFLNRMMRQKKWGRRGNFFVPSFLTYDMRCKMSR